jgi:hypothetical protein
MHGLLASQIVCKAALGKITEAGLATKKQAEPLSAVELTTLLDHNCPPGTLLSPDVLSSQQYANLKFLSLGLNCLLRGSSEQCSMQIENLLPILMDNTANARFINIDPASFSQKTFKGGMHEGNAVSPFCSDMRSRERRLQTDHQKVYNYTYKFDHLKVYKFDHLKVYKFDHLKVYKFDHLKVYMPKKKNSSHQSSHQSSQLGKAF